jgi:Fe-S-cluster containining protein
VDPSDRELAVGWLCAAEDPEVVARLEEVYTRTAEAISARGPACWASGRCCNFAKTGHLLYVTGLEAAYCVARAGRPLTVGSIELAQASGGCPYQAANLCGVHPIRPLGCRVYFCDRSAQVWQQELYERELGEVRAIHDRFGVEYRYGEWRSMLTKLAAPE